MDDPVVTRSVLLVDDDDELRTNLADFLSDEGFSVYGARHGREALDRLAEIDPPGLILLDLTMPEMDGRQFLAVRRTDPRIARIPVVILSAVTGKWTGDTVGADDVLTKPISLEELLVIVTKYCGQGSREAAPR
jgi:CheY-like chemotaxis protein